MEPVLHLDIRSLKDRLDLIAGRIDISVRTMQKPRTGPEYMLHELASEIVRGTSMDERDPRAQFEPMRRVFRWTQFNIGYRQDPADYDYYMSAGRTIRAGAGDCDDHVILNNALLSSIGYTVGSRVISPNGQGWHIYSIIGVDPAFNGVPTRAVPLDTSIRNPGADDIGWEPPMKYRRFERECLFKAGKVVNYIEVRNG